MGKITVLPETTKNPITLIGERAGICWGADITNQEKNYKRGLDCIKSNHGRTLEYPNIEIIIDGYSAKCMREWYTHIGCLPTRLQASTRYINYENFKYVTPHTIENIPQAKEIFNKHMQETSNIINQLTQLGIPREDASMVLPLTMETKVVDKRNLRNYIDMSHQRLCKRAYWEFREMLSDIFNELKKISDEWEYIVDNYMQPKCVWMGKCTEQRGCGYINKISKGE